MANSIVIIFYLAYYGTELNIITAFVNDIVFANTGNITFTSIINIIIIVLFIYFYFF